MNSGAILKKSDLGYPSPHVVALERIELPDTMEAGGPVPVQSAGPLHFSPSKMKDLENMNMLSDTIQVELGVHIIILSYIVPCRMSFFMTKNQTCLKNSSCFGNDLPTNGLNPFPSSNSHSRSPIVAKIEYD